MGIKYVSKYSNIIQLQKTNKITYFGYSVIFKPSGNEVSITPLTYVYIWNTKKKNPK